MALNSYDFVIAGGGTAGLVLASRLSEDESQSVLVIEAGSDQSDNLQAKIPAFYAALLGGKADWNFASVAQPNLLGRTVQLNQGKALGGSSILNAQVFAPPTPGIIDSWASLGNDGWDWESLRSFYEKSYTYPSIPKSSWETLGIGSWPTQNNNDQGPIQTSFPLATHPIRKAWVETFEKLGYRKDDDLWVDRSIGAFNNLASVDPISRERSQSANRYYDPIKNRKNIHVLTNATVEKILFKEGSTDAIGFQYHHDSTTKSVTARKEVIIAAGAIQSPKILELSGIGKRDILVQHGIDVVKDLPGVGEGLQDHLVVDLCFEAEDLETRDAIIRREPEAVQKAMVEYMANRTGILTSSGTLTYAYMPVNTLKSQDGHQRLQTLLEENRPKKGNFEERDLARALAFYDVAEKALLDPSMPSGVYLSSLGQNPLESDPVTGQRTYKPLPGKHLVLAGILSHPTSRGSVHIQSSNVSDVPAIDPNYLSNPVDIEIFAEHMLYLQSLASASPLSELLKRPPKPSRAISHLADLEGAKDYIRIRAASMWHPAGTCPMLPEEIGGVVDSHLRVHGVKNLRVVDASIVPVLPPGNLQSTVYAVAEKAASLIKSQHGS
ncbi:oxidoreductase [Annulohypoxylon maeteangense]|uniref:oxidoreductase n=1 Tax=Annulohypoxylon maeteangense TaxID=1927788 RepID=UPI002008B34E|nr:oxidoreductase [Annulohypoxylon maeteangense]KAI0884269.1 oxidoreductase [Annulohypoxylon maeteangense]